MTAQFKPSLKASWKQDGGGDIWEGGPWIFELLDRPQILEPSGVLNLKAAELFLSGPLVFGATCPKR